MQAPQPGLAAYLARLHSHLDTATLDATLGLMIVECRTEIRKHRDLIALQRLGGHDTNQHMERLDELLARETDLVAAVELWCDGGEPGAETKDTLSRADTVVALRR